MIQSEEMNERGAGIWAKAQALARAAAAVRGGVPCRVPPLLFFTDPERTPRPWEIAARMPPGSGVVYRGFGQSDGSAIATRLRTVTAARGMILLIGRDADLAQAVGADGVHLPEHALSAAYSLSGRRPDWILTGAVHSVAAARGAKDLDAVVLSPIFAAGGASAATTPLGIEALIRAAQVATPVFALGGVDAETIDRLIPSGAAGVAAIAGVAQAFGNVASEAEQGL